MATIKVGYVPVGVKISPAPPENYPAAEHYTGISYCDAVRRASDGSGKAFMIDDKSIETCLWCPVVLGFRNPDPKFNLKVEYSLPVPTASVLLAPVFRFGNHNPPDVVLIRATRTELKKIIDALGLENCAADLAGRLDRSALEIFSPGGNHIAKTRIQVVNKTLAALNRSGEWRKFTKWAFKRKWATYIFDILLDRYLANMSICRNSTVIPYLSGKANISYFCTGGISWGLNKPDHLTCGMPFDLYESLVLEWD
jgi:hypothetical protein